MGEQKLIVERYRKEVYRIGWRLQYYNKKIFHNEAQGLDFTFIQQDFTDTSIKNIWIQNEFSRLPDKGRTILHKLYIEDLSEVEVAKQLQMSQQAVSKWKKKMLHQLSQMMSF